VNASEIKSQAERARKSLTDTGKRRTVSEVLEPAGLPWNAFVAAGVFAVVLAVAIRIHSGVVTLNDAAAVGTGAVMFTIPFFGLRDARRGPQRWAAWVRREHPPHVQTHSLVLPAPDLRPVRRTAITSLVLIGLALALVGIVTSLDGGVSPMALGFAPLAGLYGLVGGSLLGRAQAPASSPEV